MNIFKNRSAIYGWLSMVVFTNGVQILVIQQRFRMNVVFFFGWMHLRQLKLIRSVLDNSIKVMSSPSAVMVYARTCLIWRILSWGYWEPLLPAHLFCSMQINLRLWRLCSVQPLRGDSPELHTKLAQLTTTRNSPACVARLPVGSRSTVTRPA